MKHCIDCRYFDIDTGERFEKCRAPQNRFNENPVTGERKQIQPYCDLHRTAPFPIYFIERVCGKPGRWFEPKEAA